MKRSTLLLAIAICAAAAPLGMTAAQSVPTVTPTAPPPVINLAPVTVTPTPTLGGPTPTLITLGTPSSPTPGPTSTQPVINLAPTFTATPTIERPPLGVEATEALPTVIAARTDLELLADEAFGVGVRPALWNGSLDVGDNELPALARIDLENMAGTLLAPNERPEGWFGTVASSPISVARDLRHDLELLADVVMGAPTLRPAGWQGDDPIMRCGRAAQALVGLLGRSGFVVNVDFDEPGACTLLENEVSRFVETQIIQPRLPQQITASGAIEQTGEVTTDPFQVTSPFVVAFADRNARERLGVIPLGTGYTPVARSYFGYSNMMLIRGADFQVLVDYTTTSVPDSVFLTLPDINATGSSVDCEAFWCELNP